MRMLLGGHPASFHRRMRVEHRFDFFAEELHAGHVDPRRATSRQVQVAVGVEPALVSSAKAVRFHDARGWCPRIEVGVEKAGTANADLAARLRAGALGGLAVFAAQPHLVRRLRATEDIGLGRATGGVHHREPHFHNAESLHDGDAVARGECLGDFRAQPFGGGDREA